MSLTFAVRGKGDLSEGLTHLPAASSLPDLSLVTDPPFLHVAPTEKQPPGVGNQQAPFVNAVVNLRGVEARANPVSDLDLESLIFSGGC